MEQASEASWRSPGPLPCPLPHPWSLPQLPQDHLYHLGASPYMLKRPAVNRSEHP